MRYPLFLSVVFVGLLASSPVSFSTEKLGQDNPTDLNSKPETIIPNIYNGHSPSRSMGDKSQHIETVCFKTGQRSQKFYAHGALYGPNITPMEYLLSRHKLLRKKGDVFSVREQGCLTTALYYEARGENLKGQIAVAQVIINRVISDDFPSTICGVVYQRKKRCQFSFACDKSKRLTVDPASWEQAQMVVRNFVSGNIWLDSIANATYFHTESVTPSWAKRFCRLGQVGSHIFYKTPDAFRLRLGLHAQENPK